MIDDWKQRAACRGMAPADGRTRPHPFFPETKGEAAAVATICGACPVREACGEAGYGQVGVWGGHLRRQRLDRSTALTTVHEEAGAIRDAIHRAFGRGDSPAEIAASVGRVRRNVYRHLGMECTVSSCWCRRRSEVPLSRWQSTTEATG